MGRGGWEPDGRPGPRFAGPEPFEVQAKLLGPVLGNHDPVGAGVHRGRALTAEGCGGLAHVGLGDGKGNVGGDLRSVCRNLCA